MVGVGLGSAATLPLGLGQFHQAGLGRGRTPLRVVGALLGERDGSAPSAPPEDAGKEHEGHGCDESPLHAASFTRLLASCTAGARRTMCS